MKRVIVTANTAWNILNFRLGLIKALQGEGYQVYALSPEDDYVKNLTEIGVIFHHIDVDQKGMNPLADLKIIRTYRRLFRAIMPDIVLSYTIKPNIYSNLAATNLNIPVISNISGLGTAFISRSLLTYLSLLMYKIALQGNGHTFFQNDDDAQLFQRHRVVSRNKCSIIPGSGVNTKTFQTDRTTNKGVTFLFVGRLIGDKGLREFIEAAHLITENNATARFWIIGELGYNNKTSLKKEEFELLLGENPRIQYLGKMDEVAPILVKADVMVLPSYREGLSKSLLEALAMSLPIITTDVPGCREVVVDGVNGLLCEARNVNSLKSKIQDMIDFSEETRIQMGKHSRRLATQSFSEELVIAAYMHQIAAKTGVDSPFDPPFFLV